MKNIKYQLISASGNPTAIVYGKYPPLIKTKINRAIFTSNKLVEQIGYVFKNSSGYVFKMMGNEFSGNGCRAAGFSILKFKNGVIKFKTTGINKIVSVTIKDNKISILSLPYCPIRKRVLENNLGSLIKVFGSLMLIIEGKGGIDQSRKIISQNFKNVNAVGIMFIKRLSKNKIRLNPFFYVKKTKTLINETACGSGSIAAAVCLNYKEGGSLRKTEVKQPSGESIFVSMNSRQSKINQIKIYGPTKFLGNYTVKNL